MIDQATDVNDGDGTPAMSQPLPSTLPPASRVPVGRRAQQRVDTRERLFEAALAEFSSRGVHGAQIDRIAKAASVVRGTFYFHFPSKEDVLLELRRRMEQKALLGVTPLRLAPPPLYDVLLRVVDAVRDAVSVGSTEVLRETLSLYVRRPEPEEGPEGVTSLRDELVFHIAAAQERGELRAGLEADQLAMLFLTSLFGFIAHLEGEELRIALHSLAGIIFKGIRS